METSYIQNFLKVVDCGSMSEAARQLQLSPAAIAQQMRVLEHDMGCSLLVRQGRNVRPNGAGQRLYAKGQLLLRALHELRDHVGAEEDAGELRLGTLNTALHGFLPDVLRRFTQAHARVQLHIRTGLAPELYAALMHGELDAALCLKPTFELPKSVLWHPLRHEPLVVLAPAASAHLGPLELLRTQPLIRYDRRLGGGKLADDHLRTLGITPLERFEINSVLAIAMLVEHGLGVALVPDIGPALTQGRTIQALPLPQTTPSAPSGREVGLLWMRASPRQGWIQGLLQCAQAAPPQG
ncbi:UNVERIFIED_ORG: DNA-binding transcriptional LysR family regulator [Comamonas terrigena]